MHGEERDPQRRGDGMKSQTQRFAGEWTFPAQFGEDTPQFMTVNGKFSKAGGLLLKDFGPQRGRRLGDYFIGPREFGVHLLGGLAQREQFPAGLFEFGLGGECALQLGRRAEYNFNLVVGHGSEYGQGERTAAEVRGDGWFRLATEGTEQMRYRGDLFNQVSPARGVLTGDGLSVQPDEVIVQLECVH